MASHMATAEPPAALARNISRQSSGSDFDAWLRLLPPTSTPRGHLLEDALEELFFNVTISMASSPLLQYNTTNPFAPANVSVTFNKYGNIYSYSEQRLWLSYGLAIFCSALSVISGLLVMAQTGASFTSSFSTIVRVAKTPDSMSTWMRTTQSAESP
ncbi:hypothetical protein Slin14017_G097150 [Septoria linicola]|nr:hypothetical protein Slin14017_G097150 [Septoria linicola]